MLPLDVPADDLVSRLLGIALSEPVFLLDPCGKTGWAGGRLIAGLRPERSFLFSGRDPQMVLASMDAFERREEALILTASYDLGARLNGVRSRHLQYLEPDVFAVLFSALIVHDYATGQTFIDGKEAAARELHHKIESTNPPIVAPSFLESTANFVTSKSDYLAAVEEILEQIKKGETYQTNLTQKIFVPCDSRAGPGLLFWRLRGYHPAEFSAFLDRGEDVVVSISPERFFRTRPGSSGDKIFSSPIKGTRPRTGDRTKDSAELEDLVTSEKDRAENIMITDLLRNDLGRVCEYGSVSVDSLCEVRELPSLFHLESTISGDLHSGTRLSEIMEALFPCGSITGCPKIRTMEIIDRLEPAARGLSMGTIGFSFHSDTFPALGSLMGDRPGRFRDFSVAIRTAVVRNEVAELNVGGGIVIDSEPEAEYAESLDKAGAILAALGADIPPEEPVRDDPGPSGTFEGA